MKTPALAISFIIILFFCGTVSYLNESRYNWLSASTVKFTNNWLSDGIAADRYTMLEQPLSIEAQTPEERTPYISYPNGVVLLTYATAKLLNLQQIDMDFIKSFATFLYLSDAILIGILVYLFLFHILKLKSGYGNIILPVFLSCLWICLPNNVYFLKNVFFADQMVLVFIYLFLLLELLKNYAGIKSPVKRLVINILLAITIFAGMLIEYYFWLQLFAVCLVHFAGSLIRKEKAADTLKSLSVYIIPALVAVGLFLLQITQFDDWREIMAAKFTERTGHANTVAGNYIPRIGYHVYKSYKSAGLLLFAASLVALVYLSAIALRKDRLQNEKHRNILKFSFLVIFPALVHLSVLMNHSAKHEFSVIKLGFPFILGLVLIACSVSVYRRKSKTYFLSLTTVLVTGYLFYIQWNITDFYGKRMIPDDWEKPRGFEPVVRKLNSYENVFFSFTDSIPENPPVFVAQTKKMMYKIDTPADIGKKFPRLSDKAGIMLLVNRNAEKSDRILQAEQSATENAELIEETGCFAVYRLHGTR